MKKARIAVIKGDGIGPEVINQGMRVIESAASRDNLSIDWVEYPHGADHYLRTGELINEETLKDIKKKCEAIYLGALGDPLVKPGVLEHGILLKIRFYFEQYVNLRPIKLLSGVETPLKGKGPKDIDFTVVRENTEDFYIGLGGRIRPGKNSTRLEVMRELYKLKFDIDIDNTGDEAAYQLGVISRKGAERVVRYSFDFASSRSLKKVTAVDKANVLTEMYSLWRAVVEEISMSYPLIEHEFNFVDAVTMWLLKKPEHYKVIVAPNMFGDIITDLGAMIQGGMGFAPGANINPDGISMFEPIHGSAPKFRGKDTANPIAAIWSGAMMMENCGHKKTAQRIVSAIESVLAEGKARTQDMGGNSSCSGMGAAICERVSEMPETDKAETGEDG